MDEHGCMPCQESYDDLPVIADSDLRLLQEDLQNIELYEPVKCKDHFLSKFPQIRYFTGAQILASQEDLKLRATGFVALAHCLNFTSQTMLPDGRLLCDQELCLEALVYEPNNAHAWIVLGMAMKNRHVITVPDGRNMSKRDVYIEAVRHMQHGACSPRLFASHYCRLGAILEGSERVTLHNGQVLSEVDLYDEALRFDSTFAHAYYNISSLLNTDEETRILPDGRRMNKTQLLLQSLIFDPSDTDTLTELRSEMANCSTWTPRAHAVNVFRPKTNVLFATFLLGLQRLEETEVLPLAHQAMLEDTLECWTWRDDSDLELLNALCWR